MKDDTPDQPLAETPDAGQEQWLSRDEILELFPSVTERQLKYWRDNDKIEFKTIRKRSYYLESSVRVQVEKLKTAKPYSRIINLLELRTIDPPIAILIVAAGFLFMNDFSFKDPWQAWFFKNWTSIELITIALGWYLVRWIRNTRKRYQEKKG
jgi:hypothetical protein